MIGYIDTEGSQNAIGIFPGKTECAIESLLDNSQVFHCFRYDTKLPF